ncbi:MAG: N-6 DNA methylase [Candidatus Diapherotrites archaeon]|nr:N-6 DNA methylase [Candidatus Diapherotrites archaeon]
MVGAGGKLQENSFNALLTKELIDLELDANFEEHFTTFQGLKKPDISIKFKDTYFFVESKQEPAKLIDAISKAYLYQQSIRQAKLNTIVFGVLFPKDGGTKKIEAACLLNKEPFFQQETFFTLGELARWIKEVITEEKPIAELSTTKFIKILTEAVHSIDKNLKTLKLDEIESIFGGKTFFETILGYSEEEKIPIENLRVASSYLLVNQIFFYQILATETKKYPLFDVEKITSSNEIYDRHFAKVLEDDYEPIFSFNIISKLSGKEALANVLTVVSAIQALSTSKQNHDLLGKIFHNLIPLDIRKVVAAFYTNSEAGNLLADLAIEKFDEKILDTACGSGTLLVSSYRRKKELFEKQFGDFSEDAHKKFLSKDIFGVDIMPFAAHLAAINLALQAPLYETDILNIAIHDSTDLSPERELEAAEETIREGFKQQKLFDFGKSRAEKTSAKGVVSLYKNKHKIVLPYFDVVIMNPPFTRFQRIPPEFKQILENRFSGKYRKIISGQLGLHGYFLLLADKFLKEDGRIAAVLPLTTISTSSFYQLIKMLLEEYCIEYVVASDGRAAFSENTSLREILLIAKKQKPKKDHELKLVILNMSPAQLNEKTTKEISMRLRQFSALELKEKEEDYFYIKTFKQEDLKANIRQLYHSITLSSKELIQINKKLEKVLENEKTETLKIISEKNRWEIKENPRGLNIYNYSALTILNDEKRALKKTDFWLAKEKTREFVTVLNKINGNKFKIPTKALAKQFRRFSTINTINIDKKTDYLVKDDFQGFEVFLENGFVKRSEIKKTAKAIEFGEFNTFIQRNSSNLFFFYRGDLTAPNTNCLSVNCQEKVFAGSGGSWVFYGLKNNEANNLSLWLNSSLQLFQVLRDRKETRGGWMEIDKYVLDESKILNLDKLTKTDKEKLDNLYEKIKDTQFPSLIEQLKTKNSIRKQIDTTFLSILGMNKAEAESLLEELYPAIYKELVKLKGVMGK